MIIIQDSREKIPWKFLGTFEECTGQIVRKIDAGDYILLGHERLITIDRKRNVSELATNLGLHRERFERELARMQNYAYKYILCEFTYDELLKFPYGCGLPKHIRKKIRVHGKYLAKKIAYYSEEYDLDFVFCDGVMAAQEKAIELFQKALKVYEK